MAKIKKVVITAYGDESVLAVVEAELPEPAAGEVQLVVEYSITSGSDVNMRRGTYPLQKKPPLTPGYSVVGTVVTNGKGCSKFAVGERVACLSKYEGQAERINLPEKYLVPVPDGVDGGEAVAVVLDWVTAYEMLYRSAKVKAGQKIFVHGLSGGVGGALLRLGKLIGAEVYGTASAKKHEELRALGAVPLDYANKNWIGEMQRMGGVDAVFDALGFESFDESYSILKKGGDPGGVWDESAGMGWNPCTGDTADGAEVVCAEFSGVGGKEDHVLRGAAELQELCAGPGDAVRVAKGGQDFRADQGEVQAGRDSGGASSVCGECGDGIDCD